MATSVKAAATSTLKVETGHSISTSSHTNTGITAAQAPVLLTVQAERVVTASELAALVAGGNADISIASAARMLNLVNEVVSDIVSESVEANTAPAIDLGWGKLVFEIGGSLLTATQTPSLITNPCYFSGQVASKYQAQFRLIKATASTADNPCAISRVRDAQTAEPNVIYGTDDFYVDGRGLVWTGATDKHALYDAMGTTKIVDITVDSNKSYRNSMKCKLPGTTAVPVGTYLVMVDCTIAGTIYHMSQKVTVAEAVTPA